MRNWWALRNTSKTEAVLQSRPLTTLSTTGPTTRTPPHALRHTRSATENPQCRHRHTNSVAQSAHHTPPHKLSSADPKASTPTWSGLVLWAGCFEGCWLLLVVLCPLARVLVG